MTPEEFIDKWRSADLKESGAYQEHFVDLCRLLEVPTPAQADKKGVDYAFQKHVGTSAGGKGFADVWKKTASSGNTRATPRTWSRPMSRPGNMPTFSATRR